MTRWVLLALLPVASSCMAQQWYTTRPIPVESMPDRIVPDPARGGPKELAVDRCTSPLIDPATGTRFRIERSDLLPNGPIGDYSLEPGDAYGATKDQYVRVDCAIGRPLGLVPR